MADELQWKNRARINQGNASGKVMIETEDGFLLNTITDHETFLRPGVRVRVVMTKNDSGEPSVWSITFDSKHGEDEIRPEDLRRIKFDELYEAAMSVGYLAPKAAVGFGPGDNVDRVIGDAYRDFSQSEATAIVDGLRDFSQGEMKATLKRRRRRRVTTELLTEAAALYQRQDIGAVADRFHVSKSQAHRYIAEARNQGLID